MSTSYALSSWFFARSLSFIYFVAFMSLLPQARGLWGTRGVLPVGEYLQAVEKQVGAEGYWRIPSVFWLSSADDVLTGAALIGASAALLSLIGFAQGWMFALCFLLYLSFTATGQEFMSFQWDTLLLEVGFLTLFAVPWTFSFQLGLAEEPHWLVRCGFYFVLFKLMFLSGVVKLSSGDTSWRDLTALTYHYFTQPLPNPLAPFVHALPAWAHKGGTATTFVVELACPFLIFWPRARVIAAAAFMALSLTILLTGNFTFFNWLTIALCFWLIPDGFWHSLVDLTPWTLNSLPHVVSPHPIAAVMAVILISLSVVWSTRWLFPDRVNAVINPVLRLAQTFHISSSYGLFANMTKERPEIVIEGSLDGRVWKEYEFRYKPGGLYRRPPIVAPHQPRLDWQMWFAALGGFQHSPFVTNLMFRIFEASPEVLKFFAWNPFPDQPPKYLRARMYRYEFAPPDAILSSGQWWSREPLGSFSPTFERP